MSLERQELWCHDCGNYVQFDVDVSLNGNHVLECPECGHEHCRVVEDGIITDIRWDSRNGNAGRVFQINSSSVTTSANSTWTTYSAASSSTSSSTSSSSSAASVFLYDSWMNT